jgi:hypothetical protein
MKASEGWRSNSTIWGKRATSCPGRLPPGEPPPPLSPLFLSGPGRAPDEPQTGPRQKSHRVAAVAWAALARSALRGGSPSDTHVEQGKATGAVCTRCNVSGSFLTVSDYFRYSRGERHKTNAIWVRITTLYEDLNDDYQFL